MVLFRSWESLGNRPSFYTFNHRGKKLYSDLPQSSNWWSLFIQYICTNYTHGLNYKTLISTKIDIVRWTLNIETVMLIIQYSSLLHNYLYVHVVIPRTLYYIIIQLSFLILFKCSVLACCISHSSSVALCQKAMNSFY